MEQMSELFYNECVCIIDKGLIVMVKEVCFFFSYFFIYVEEGVERYGVGVGGLGNWVRFVFVVEIFFVSFEVFIQGDCFV